MLSSHSFLLADGNNWALIVFAIYMVGVVLLAAGSHKLLQSKTFLNEYFLGSRSLGVWAFALTFAATSSSGGSFIGFPSLVYTHGWVVALWIGSYMIVPLVSMGLLGKRLNQTARKTGAITIPDVMRDRFDSPAFGILATALIVFFMVFNLIAQFKGGSVILQSLLADTPMFMDFGTWTGKMIHELPMGGLLVGVNPHYLICLIVFTLAVVAYTAYGGFRAVVWTDVMQGFVMVGGVLIMLPLALWMVGGMQNITDKMTAMTPPSNVELRIETAEPVTERLALPKNTWLVYEENGERNVYRLKEGAEIPKGESVAIIRGSEKTDANIGGIKITTESQAKEIQATELHTEVAVHVTKTDPLAFGEDQQGVYVTGPGPHASRNTGFLPLSLGISFFFMWTFSGAGQPSNMVRLMAFDSSKTFRRAIFTVSIYYTLIYFPLVIIFCAARVLMPGWETESDRIMPEMAKMLTESAGAPWLAGLLAAAPFAAVMSTMDSFLLMISSAVVRDIYQRNINPEATEKTVKRMTYVVTIVIGAAAMIAAIKPPEFLQDIIVFTGSGLSSSFLAPVTLMLYWERFNKQGAFVAMIGGFCAQIGLYIVGYIIHKDFQAYEPLGFHPFLVGSAFSFAVGIIAALVTPAPPRYLVEKFFYVEEK